MKLIAQFIWSMLAVQLAGFLLLMVAGLVLALAERSNGWNETFFSYEIRHFGRCPFWFAAALTLMLVNGIGLSRLAIIELEFSTPPTGAFGTYSAFLPVNHLRLVALNLVVIPVLLGAFIAVRKSAF